MVKIELNIDEQRSDKFREVCWLSGIEPSVKINNMIDEAIDAYWENHKRRESKNTKIIEIGVQHMIPPAY